MAGDDTVYCSFCGKAAEEVQKVIAGPHGIYICDECVALCVQILDGDDGESRPVAPDWSQMETGHLLARLPKIAQSSDQADQGLRRVVAELRKRAVSWAAIGSALGLTRQTVWERFSERGHDGPNS